MRLPRVLPSCSLMGLARPASTVRTDRQCLVYPHPRNALEQPFM